MKIVGIEEKGAIEMIVKFLQKGEVLVLPTETVYGLVCDGRNEKSIRRLFDIKQRSDRKPIGIFVKDIKMAKEFAEIDRSKEKILQKYWPGKITFIFQRKNSSSIFQRKNSLSIFQKKGYLPAILFGGETTIGARFSDYFLLREIFKIINFPLAQTSANISGQPSLTKIEDVLKQFQNRKEQPDLIIDAGDLGDNLASTVVDLTGNKPEIIRQGEIKFVGV